MTLIVRDPDPDPVLDLVLDPDPHRESMLDPACHAATEVLTVPQFARIARNRHP